MPLSLEELKQQRAQIQQHLDWLDTKIVELEPLEAKAKIDKPAPTREERTQKVASSANSETHKNTETPQAAEPNEAQATRPVLSPDIEAPTYKAKTQGEIKRAKIGCFVLFVLGTALFLFLLFGLPYLL